MAQLINPETGKILADGSMDRVLMCLRILFPEHANELPKLMPHSNRDYNATRRVVEAFAASKGYDIYI